MSSGGPDQIRLLINEDDGSLRKTLVTRLESQGYQCLEARDGREGLRVFVHERPDIVLTDLQMSPVDGLEFLRRAKEIRPETPIVVLSAHGSEENLLNALRLGATDFLRKPIAFSALDTAVRNAMRSESGDGNGTNKAISQTIVGRSPQITSLTGKIKKLARAGRSTVLILGESGTGKEVVAHHIHRLSGCSGPFIPLNCAISDGGLIENSLFGHERGAFTDAKTREKGLIEHAHRGTLFLDEIGEMHIEVQAKLLRFLETGSFRRIGGREQINVETRVVAATHRNLSEMVRANHFREDLYFRLNVLPIQVPPLRDRGDDLFLLAQHFIEQAAADLGQPPPRISQNARAFLASYDWPGNVRELKNLMERFVLLQEGLTVDIEDLPPELTDPACLSLVPSPAEPPASSPTVPYADARRSFEHNYFRTLLEQHHGNVASVARASGLDPSNVRRVLRRHSLDPAIFRNRRNAPPAAP